MSSSQNPSDLSCPMSFLGRSRLQPASRTASDQVPPWGKTKPHRCDAHDMKWCCGLRTRSWCLLAIASVMLSVLPACSSNPPPRPDATSSSGGVSEESEANTESASEATDAEANLPDDASAAEGMAEAEMADAGTTATSDAGVAVPEIEAFDTFLSFRQEAERLNMLLRCPEGKLYPPAFDGDGTLYKCVTGDRESLRIFLREDPETESVKNLKILWVGQQIPESESRSQRLIQTLADYYGGDRADEIRNVFWDDDNEAIETDTLDMEYRYRPETGGGEHLLVIVPRP